MALFNGLHLQRGDKDGSDPLDPKKPPRYQGTPRSDLAGETFVAQLQKLLSTLGFGFIKPDDKGNFDGRFGLLTEMAVREFQIYAASTDVAQHDSRSKQKERIFDALKPFSLEVENRYIELATGDPFPATGVVNSRTAELLEFWRDNELRCPVILTAFSVSGNLRDATRTAQVSPSTSNLWRHDELKDKESKVRVFARDFTTDFRRDNDKRKVTRVEMLEQGATKLIFDSQEISLVDLSNTTSAEQIKEFLLPSMKATSDDLEVIGPSGGPWDIRFTGNAERRNQAELGKLSASEPDKLLVTLVPAWEEVGDFVKYKSSGGPRSHPRVHTLKSELTPEAFTGENEEKINESVDKRSTYRVLRAVAEAECVGYFDSVNAYDPGVVSVGPCHWTFALGQSGGIAAAGELAGFVAYYKNKAPEEFKTLFTRFGLDVDREWGEDGSQLYSSQLRTYSNCWWTRPNEGGNTTPVPQTLAEVNYYRSWHWFYRWVMAGRTMPGYCKAMYDVARVRLRDLLSALFADEEDLPKQSTNQEGGTRPATLGEVFSSEAATALLLRWHINQPGRVLRKGLASNRIKQVIEKAGVKVKDMVDTWTDTEQEELIKALFDQIKDSANHLSSTLPNVATETAGEMAKGWPGYPGRDRLGYLLTPPKDTTPETEQSDLEKLVNKPLLREAKSFKFDREIPETPRQPPSVPTGQGSNVPDVFQIIPARTGEKEPREIKKPNQTFGLALIGLLSDVGQYDVQAIVLTALDKGGQAPIDEDENSGGSPVASLTNPVPDPDRVFGFAIPLVNLVSVDVEVDDEAKDVQDTLYIANSGQQPDLPEDAHLSVRSLRNSNTLKGRRLELDLAQLFSPLDHNQSLDLKATLVVDDFSQGDSGSLNVAAHLDVVLNHSLLPRPFRWSFAISSSSSEASGKLPTWFRFAMADPGNPEEVDGAWLEFRTGADFGEIARNSPLDLGLPVVLNKTTEVEAEISAALRLSIGPDGKLWPVLEATLKGEIGIDLGSPLARLALNPGPNGLKLRYDPEQGLALELPTSAKANLRLDLFNVFKGTNAVVNNVWSASGDNQKWLVDLEARTLLDESPEPLVIRWTGAYPEVARSLFEKLFHDAKPPVVSSDRQLQSLSGRVLGADLSTRVTFKQCREGNKTTFTFVDGTPQLRACMGVSVAGGETDNVLLEADGTFVFTMHADENGLLRFQPGALSCTATTLVRTGSAIGSRFGNAMVSLHVPKGTAFWIDCDPSNPSIRWVPEESRKTTPQPISIRVPGSNEQTTDKPEDFRFTFDLEEFRLHSAGIDLRGSARAEGVKLGKPDTTGFDGAVSVRSPEKTGGATERNTERPAAVGEIIFKNSRLIAGSLQASAKLRYFDDAVGTLRINLSESEDESRTLACAGTLDVAGVSEFRVAPLFALFRLTAFSLGIIYTETDQWKSTARLTGRIEFTPPVGRSASEMGELSDLFGGVAVEFEDLDLLKLGKEQVRFDFPAKRFSFAEILIVELRALTIKEDSDFKLNGDISMSNLPGVDSSLTLSEISLIRAKGFGPPEFKVGRIGASFDVPGGFRLDGQLEHVDMANESGFVGGFAITTESLPRMSGIVKLTRIRAINGDMVPSMAVFVEADFEAALFGGFYLRSLGVGIGVYQALRGLEPSNQPLPQKIVALVNNPQGLPQPRQVDSWVPARPQTSRGPLNWMLVGSGLITYSKLERNKPHPFAGSLLLAIDQGLQIIAGVTLWLFTSPDETRDPAFIQRPVGRGALGISVRERRVFAMFRTLPRPKLGKDTPKLLGEVLSRVETTMLFSADPNGLLLEVGWPWETKIGPYRLGPFEGTLTSGFRFGLYRGVMTFGLNYAIAVQLRAQAKWGFDAGFGSARASIGIEGSGLFRASFAGAIDSKFNTFLIGDVRLATTVRLYAAAEASFRIRITRWLKISKTIRFRRTLNLAINAALTAALDSQANVGFRGEAQIAVSICGYRLAGRVAFEHEAGQIERIRTEINKLLPPSPLAETARFSQATPTPKEATNWHYRFRRLQLADGTNVIRVLLFPQPGLEYPRPQFSGANPEASPRFNIPLMQSVQDKFRGFVGSPRLDNDLSGNLLQWSEALDQTVDQIPYEDETTTKSQDITLADLLGFVETEKNTSNRNCFDSNLQKEVADERAIRPGAATSDDETAGLEQAGGPVSPNLSRTASAYDTALTDAWQNKKEPAPVVKSILLADLPEFEKLENLTSNRLEDRFTIQPSSDDQEETAIHIFISNLLKTSSVAAEAISAPFEVAEVSLDRPAEETAKTDALTARYRTFWGLPDIVPNGDARIWRISLDDGARQGHILRRREGTAVEVTDIEEVRAISSGLILAELLELLGDDLLSGGVDFQSAAASTSVSGELDDSYRIAPYMRLVLEFLEFADGEPGRLAADPVPSLIRLEENGAPVPMILGGVDGRYLMSVLGPTGRLLAPPEYDFFPGPVYQSAQQIGLTWRFLREDEIDIGRAGGEGGSGEDPFLPYQELEKFIVTRTNLSRPADPPRVVEILPVWLVAGVDADEGKEQLVKPQLQFVDDDIQGVQENDLLQYRVEARATDRPLASFLLNVVRQTLTPLESLGQALALHWIDAAPPHRQGKVEIVVAAEQPVFEPSQLRILYRRVPATTIGAYGFETRPPVDTCLVPGVPSRAADKNFPDVRFAESESTRTIPWADVLDLEDVLKQRSESRPFWEPVMLRRRDPRTGEFRNDKIIAGYRAVLAEEDLRRALGEVAGEAIELYIGREDREDKDPTTNRALRRSPLTRCRHAVTPLNTRTPPDTVPDEQVFEANRGNPVDALEWLPAMTRGPEFLPKTAIRAVAEYVDPPSPADPEQKVQPPLVAVEWAHDTRSRGRAIEADDSAFDPVIGYRIHRLDRHDPALLTGAAPADDSDFPALERVVSVVPEAYYRSQPESVAVMGLRKFDSPQDDKDQPAGLDELVSRLTDIPAVDHTPDWVAMRTPPDWLPMRLRDPIDPAVAPPVDAFEQYPIDSHVGPVWLHKALWSGVKKLRISLEQNLNANSDDIKFDLRFLRPLPYWSPIAPGEGNPAAQDRLETLKKELNNEVDPYGWLTAEALGRSCECRFRTRNDDRPMRAEQVLDAFAAVVDSDVVLGQDSSGTDVKAKLGAFLQVVIFTGDDARTPLNVLRLVVRQPLTQKDPSVSLGLARQLRLVDHNATKAVEDLEAIPEPVENFCAEITARLKLLTEAPAVVLRRERRGANPAEANPADRAEGTITLPIDAQGRVRLHLPVPDTWAHCYRIAIESIRRYDQIRAMLAIALRSESSTDEVSLPKSIPADYWVEVLIDRTRELVAHNILATPLPGSIQALVFRHPAAFASTANAAAKAYGQYSSQGVAFERRIPPALKEILKSGILYLKYRVVETISWDAYHDWLTANNYDHASDHSTDDHEGPFFVDCGDNSQNDPLILKPVVGTEVGVYGADRYVAPDLPGYYQYRAWAWSTAGRVTSLPMSTGWVAPLYDEERQRPATVPARARYESDHLTVELLLIHPLFHMREDLRKLWVGADHRVPVEGDEVKELPLGLLPDLALSYQVFIWQNFNPNNPNDDQAARVYIPLARVLPPSPREPWFCSKSQTPGLTVTSSNGYTPTIQPMDDDDPKGNGGLWFQLRFERSETASAVSDELFAMLRDAAEKPPKDGFASLFSITVERNGVRSELVPLPP